MACRATCAVKALCLACLPLLGVATPAAPRIYDSASDEEAERDALCFADIFQGILSLTRGVESIYAASFDCKDFHSNLPEGLEEEALQARKIVCAEAVTEIIAAVSEAASYLAATASDCQKGIQEGAYCAADITSITGAMGQVANVASAANASCGSGLLDEAEAEENPASRRLASTAASEGLAKPSMSEKARGFWESWREEVAAGRLEEVAKNAEERKEREHKLAVTDCVLDITQGLSALLRAGVALKQAVLKCKAGLLKLDRGRRVCAVDISGTVGSFSFAAEYLSFSASHCTKGLQHHKAECVGDVMMLIAALSSFAAVGAAIPLSCNDKVVDFDEGVAPGRRLADGMAALLV